MQNYENINFILIFSPFKKTFIFFLSSQLKPNIAFKLIIIFTNNKKNKLNLNFKENNNINNISFKYQKILLNIAATVAKKSLKIYKSIKRM